MRFASQSISFNNSYVVPGITTSTAAIFARITNAPGAGTRTFTLYLEGVATGVSFAITGTGTTGTASGAVAITPYTRLAVLHTTAGSPAASGGAVTIVAG